MIILRLHKFLASSLVMPTYANEKRNNLQEIKIFTPSQFNQLLALRNENPNQYFQNYFQGGRLGADPILISIVKIKILRPFP